MADLGQTAWAETGSSVKNGCYTADCVTFAEQNYRAVKRCNGLVFTTAQMVVISTDRFITFVFTLHKHYNQSTNGNEHCVKF